MKKPAVQGRASLGWRWALGHRLPSNDRAGSIPVNSTKSVEWSFDTMATFTDETPTSQVRFIADDTSNLDDWTYWATLITGTWQSSVTHIIETGDLLIMAKARLHHGEFGDMIK